MAFIEKDGVLSIEAEHFSDVATSTYVNYTQVHFWSLEPRSEASGLQAMRSLPDERGEDGEGPVAPPGKEGARLDYQILIETAGTYFVWVRGRAMGGESNGVHLGIDNVLSGGRSISGFRPHPAWNWENERKDGGEAKIEIAAGPHLLSVWNRDDGFQIDKFVLSLSSTKPTNFGPPESDRGQQQTLEVTPMNISNGQVGSDYSAQFRTTNGKAPLRWRIEGEIPPGLSLNQDTGRLTGTPSVPGSYPIQAFVEDGDGEIGARRYTILIGDPLRILSGTELPPARLGELYVSLLSASGGTPPYNWFAATKMPPGLSVDGGNGLVTGTPTEAGEFSFGVRINDAGGESVRRDFELEVQGAILQINSPTALPDAAVGRMYSHTFTAEGGEAPYGWSTPLAPSGLSLSANGVLSGTPNVDGDFVLTVAALDTAGNRSERNFTIHIEFVSFVSVSAASFEGPALAPESIATGFGVNLAAANIAATELPLPETLQGRRLEIEDSEGTRFRAQLFFVGTGQINFLVPAGVAVGTATVEVKNLIDQVLTFGEVDIQPVAPALFMVAPDRLVAGSALRVKPDDSRIEEPLSIPQGAAVIGRQLDLTVAGDQLFLIVFGSGIRGSTGSVTATLNGLPLPVLAAQAQGQFDGLDQVNLGPIPPIPPGVTIATLIVTVDGVAAPPVIVHVNSGL